MLTDQGTTWDKPEPNRIRSDCLLVFKSTGGQTGSSHDTVPETNFKILSNVN
jgi:hypothetical protein